MWSLAPCWDDEQPYYGLFLERGDLMSDGQRLVQRLDERLKQINIEYASKRDTRRLGAVRLEWVRPASGQWDRERLRRNGGTLSNTSTRA